MATLQQQVQQHLQNTGISLRELSRRSGISHQAIGKIMRLRAYVWILIAALVFVVASGLVVWGGV